MASRWFAKRRKRCRGARALDQVGVPFEDRDLVGIGYATGSGTPSSMESEHPLFKQKFSMGVGGVTEGRIAARVDDITLTLHLLTGVTQENCDRDWLRRYCGGARSSIACTTTCPPRRSMARANRPRLWLAGSLVHLSRDSCAPPELGSKSGLKLRRCSRGGLGSHSQINQDLHRQLRCVHSLRALDLVHAAHDYGRDQRVADRY